MCASWATYKLNLMVTAKLLFSGSENVYYGVYSAVYCWHLEILLLCVAVFEAWLEDVMEQAWGMVLHRDDVSVCSPT